MQTPSMLIFSGLAMSAMLLVGCHASPAATSSQAPPSEPQAQSDAPDLPTAEALGWELIDHDTFDREEIGDRWQVVNGQWEIKDGLLQGSGTLISAHPYPRQPPAAFQRLEFEAISNVKPMALLPGVKPKVALSDMDAFIHARPPGKAGESILLSGYFFQFGGNYNTANRLRHQRQTLWEDENPQPAIELDQWHHIIAENDQGVLRFFVDGKLLHEEKLTAITMGTGQDHVGLYFLTAAKVRDVKVYVKRLPNDLDLE